MDRRPSSSPHLAWRQIVSPTHALESEAENLSRLEVLHTGVPSRFAQEEEGIRVWSVEALDIEDVDVERPAHNVAGTFCEETVRELGEDIASGLPTYEEAMRGTSKI